MRVLVFTSSCGTAHDAAAYALSEWLADARSDVVVHVEHVLENASSFTRVFVRFYNWIQVHAPWFHQIYWRLLEGEDLLKPGTVLFGRRYLIKLLRSYKPDVLISTYPHSNRGHFDLAKRVVGDSLRCVTCCTELAGGFGFTRNWISPKADAIWTLTPESSQECRRRHYPAAKILELGPLLYPGFYKHIGYKQIGCKQIGPIAPAADRDDGNLPLLVLGTGGNGANNHQQLLQALLPYAGRLQVAALCGRRSSAIKAIQHWAEQHPGLAVEALDFQGPEAMARLYGSAMAMVSRPGARTATEALVAGCPLIFNHYSLTMPQELLAQRYFRAHELETSIRTPRQLAEVIGIWLDQPDVYLRLREQYRAHQLSSDPSNILEQILNG